MAVNLISVKCPDCGATLNIEADRTQAFCTYCGAKILINNENEHIYRHIDEAQVKQAETEQMALLKRLELEEKKRATDEKIMMLKIKVSLALFIGGLLMIVIGFTLGHASGDEDSGFYVLAMAGFFAVMGAAWIWIPTLNKDEDDNLGDKAKVPSSISDFKKKNYTTIEAIFKSAGFTNVKCVPLNDLTIGVLKKPGTVESITINGHNITYGGRKFLKDAPIVISYHSFAGS